MWGIIAASRVRSKPNIGFLQVKEIPNVLLGSGVNYTFSFDNQPNPNSKVLIFIATQNAGVAAEIPNAQLLITLSSNQGGRIYQPNTPLQTYTMTTLLNGRFWIYMLEIENCDIITPVGFTLNPITNNITSLSSNVLKNDVLITIHNSCPTTLPSLVASNQYTNISPSINNPVEGFSRLYDNEFLDETTTLSYTESAVNIRLFTVRLLRNYTQFLPETQAIVNRAILEGFTLPSQFTINCIDRLIREMKLSGYWQKRDLILNYAYNDDTLEDFTRINWKNPNGNLSTYVRENKYNLCGPSEDFSVINWGKVGTGASIDADVAIAPDSTMTADRWTNGTRLQQSLGNNIIVGEVYNWSVYAKADSGNLLRLHINSNIPTGNAVFDLSTGTVVSIGGLVISASISNEGSGWYRCSIVYTAEGSLIALNSVNSGESIFIWGAQLTRGAALQTYQNTVNRGILVYDNQGVIGAVASIDNYVDTNWNILNDSIAYLLDDASREAVIYKPASSTANVISGILSSVAERWGVINATANIRINQGGVNLSGGSADLRNEGYKAINRISSTDLTFFNKDVTFNRTANSTVIPNDTITIHRALNIVGDNVISYFSAGASTVAEAQNFRTAYNTYLTSIGLSPIA